ncbi:alpha/beta fold hydrolase [Arthrobacter ginkgonis]|uniref:Alpha/beta fold hydrolase n=1 Tax=Arthrobacter ginkgonis TaxID=1630594 RepID=A0ABP7C352_9MICC
MVDLSTRELQEIEEANLSERQPVVFVHGLWLLASSWDPWRDLFDQRGYTTIAPGWPDDPPTVAVARQNPEVFAHKTVQQVTDRYLAAIEILDRQPLVVGHSFGGLIAQKIAGTGAAKATSAIVPAPFRGVLPLPRTALKSAFPVLGNPANRKRAVALTYEQFNYGWTGQLPEDEARRLYDTFHVATSGIPLFEAATANINPFTGAKVDTKNPQRGPLQIVAGEKDRTVPWAISNASYKRQIRNPAPTEIIEMKDRGHSLILDHGWKEVADTVLEFFNRHG